MRCTVSLTANLDYHVKSPGAFHDGVLPLTAVSPDELILTGVRALTARSATAFRGRVGARAARLLSSRPMTTRHCHKKTPPWK